MISFGPGLRPRVNSKGDVTMTDEPKAPPKVQEPVKKETKEEKKPIREVDEPVIDPNGDLESIDPKYAEPPGTRHASQYNTEFPNEKTIRRG